MNYEGIGLLPCSIEEEEIQLQLAINSSLLESRHDEEPTGELPSTITNLHILNKSNVPCTSVNKQIPSKVEYQRSTSVGEERPPRSLLLTDCCEIKDALTMKDRHSIKTLLTSSGRMTSPIHQAAKKGHHYCLEPLLSTFPEWINSTNSSGETPLYLAAVNSKLRALQQLLRFQADPNKGKNSLETPLLAAVDNNHREMVTNLIKAGADVNVALNRGWTVLHEAVYRGHSDILGMLLRHDGNPNARDGFGISPVFTSAACGRNECLKTLLQAGGDPNLCAESKSASPLYEACKEGHEHCVITLLKNGANPHLPNCDGLFPIHIASLKGYEDIVEKLLPVTDCSLAQTCGISPIHSAAKGDHVEILQMLIDHGYDVNIKLKRDKITYRDNRQTALFFAIYNDSKAAAEILLEAGAETELDYVKSLLVAVSHSQYEIVDLLLRYGADINACFQDSSGNFPAAVAFALKDFRMLKQIIVAGCDVQKCLNCDIGDEDHLEFGEEFQQTSFCHFITEAHFKDWCSYTILFLLRLVGNTRLCRKITEEVQDSVEWREIKSLLENPRTLQHICRLAIRKSINERRLWDETIFSTLPLPHVLQDYLVFSDV